MSDKQKEQLLSRQETDWFRGVAAVMVVLSHYAEWWSQIMQAEGRTETLCMALSKLGDYGVAMFFLFSGYGMVKSLRDGKMYPGYVWKRVKSVYIPYLCIVGVLDLLSEQLAGGFESFQAFLRFLKEYDYRLFLSGYNYWYMFVLFLFYIGFIAVYAVVKPKTPRVLLFFVYTCLMSYLLYSRGAQDFWYVSNIAFALGVAAGEFEAWMRKVVDRAGIPVMAVCGVGMLFAARFGMAGGVNIGGDPSKYQVWFRIGAVLVWTLLILILAAKCDIKEKIGAFLGKNSLYLYLTHTFFFMQCVNSEGLGKMLEPIGNPERIMLLRFIIAFLITAAASFLCGLAFHALYRIGRKKEAKKFMQV